MLALALCGCSGLGIDCVNGSGEPVHKTIAVPAFHGSNWRVHGRGDRKVPFSRWAGRSEGSVGPDAAKVDDGVWHIEASKCFATDRPFTVFITIPEVDHLAIAGSGDVQADSVFGAGETLLQVAGSGGMRAGGLNEKRLIVHIQGSGDVGSGGTTTNFDAQVQGSGNIMAGSLSVAQAEVVIQGSGNAELTAIASLNATGAGSGNVRYQASPTWSRASKVPGPLFLRNEDQRVRPRRCGTAGRRHLLRPIRPRRTPIGYHDHQAPARSRAPPLPLSPVRPEHLPRHTAGADHLRPGRQHLHHGGLQCG
ncbi:MAG: DUF2807 domain-containing protein [Flavobacteriales bacterium]|nr:DUF2807 domain-containing protein [Flavobacteriales bacterium]